MFRALYTAASGMTAQQLNLDNIANNLANSSTTGFQQRQVNFTDLLYQNQIMPGAASTQQTTVAAGLQIGLGTRPSETEIIQTQGDFSTTGNPLDLAISGRGIFSNPDAQRADRLYARWLFHAGCRRAVGHRRWQPSATGDYDSVRTR